MNRRALLLSIVSLLSLAFKKDKPRCYPRDPRNHRNIRFNEMIHADRDVYESLVRLGDILRKFNPDDPIISIPAVEETKNLKNAYECLGIALRDFLKTL